MVHAMEREESWSWDSELVMEVGYKMNPLAERARELERAREFERARSVKQRVHL